MTNFTARIVRAARLDPQLYEEVEHDNGAMAQAMGVVVLASLAGGITLAMQNGSAAGLVAGTLGSLFGWYAWAFIVYLVGAKLLPEPTTEADMGQVLRTLGFSAAPGIIRVVGVVPWLALPSFLVAQLWSLAAMVVAVRQALDYESTGRAVAVCAVGWLLQLLVIVLFVLAIVGVVGTLPAASVRSA